MNERINEKIKRVTGGDGGEALLILGTEKTAIIDCGMAFCGPEMVENAKRELKGRPLDYVFVTHTHYDHIGGLPYIRQEWPNLISLGAAHGQEILKKTSALKLIEELSKVAYMDYKGLNSEPNILMEGMEIDQIVGEGDVIDLGDEKIVIMETPGHTMCSLSFFMEKHSTIYPSETIGVLTSSGRMICPVLKSHQYTMDSIEKCRRMKAKHIISPHYGWVPDELVDDYWDLAIQAVEEDKNFVIGMHGMGANEKEILEAFIEKYWINIKSNLQPKDAFIINAKKIIKVVLTDFC